MTATNSTPYPPSLSEQIDSLTEAGYSQKFLKEYSEQVIASLIEENESAPRGRARRLKEIAMLERGSMSGLQRTCALQSELKRIKAGQSKPVATAGTAKSIPGFQFPIAAVPALAAPAAARPRPAAIASPVAQATAQSSLPAAAAAVAPAKSTDLTFEDLSGAYEATFGEGSLKGIQRNLQSRSSTMLKPLKEGTPEFNARRAQEVKIIRAQFHGNGVVLPGAGEAAARAEMDHRNGPTNTASFTGLARGERNSKQDRVNAYLKTRGK